MTGKIENNCFPKSTQLKFLPPTSWKKFVILEGRDILFEIASTREGLQSDCIRRKGTVKHLMCSVDWILRCSAVRIGFACTSWVFFSIFLVYFFFSFYLPSLFDARCNWTHFSFLEYHFISILKRIFQVLFSIYRTIYIYSLFLSIYSLNNERNSYLSHSTSISFIVATSRPTGMYTGSSRYFHL